MRHTIKYKRLTYNKMRSETAYLSQCQSLHQDLNQKRYSEFESRLTWMQVSAASLPKFSGFISLSASVTMPTFVKSSWCLYDKC